MIQSLGAEVLEVHSGDDLILMVDVGMDNLYKKVRARLDGVDAPNAYKACKGTEAGKVRDEVFDVVNGRKCRIDVIKQSKSSWKVRLYLGTTEEAPCLNDLLIRKGYIYKK